MLRAHRASPPNLRATGGSRAACLPLSLWAGHRLADGGARPPAARATGLQRWCPHASSVPASQRIARPPSRPLARASVRPRFGDESSASRSRLGVQTLRHVATLFAVRVCFAARAPRTSTKSLEMHPSVVPFQPTTPKPCASAPGRPTRARAIDGRAHRAGASALAPRLAPEAPQEEARIDASKARSVPPPPPRVGDCAGALLAGARARRSARLAPRPLPADA